MNPDKTFGRLGNRLFQLAYVFSQHKRGVIPDIYVQNPEYFDSYKEELKSLLIENKEQINKVVIHVRRGDYVNNPFYVDLTKTDYYIKAMQEFPNGEFLVFSDDIEWCKEQTIFKDCEFNEENENKALETMTRCVGHIIANSSFSWWGAYLSNSKKIIAPKLWYTDNIKRTKCPKEWLRL